MSDRDYLVRVLGPVTDGARNRLSDTAVAFNPENANVLDKITRAAAHPNALMIALHAARDYLVNNHEVMDASDVLNLETSLLLLNIDLPDLD